MDRTRVSRGPGVGIIAALTCTLLLASFCKGRNLPTGQCVFNSDCSTGEICAGTYCRSQCNPAMGAGDRDCASMFGTGWHCRPSGQSSSGGTAIDVCVPPNSEGFCVYSSQCDPPFVCGLNGQCVSQCVTDYDCQTIALDMSAMCDMGTCSFRDGGASPDTGTSTGDGAVTSTDASADAATDTGTDVATDGASADSGG